MDEWARSRRLLNPAQVHFAGIGGVGMAGLARLLLQKGFRVSGSDAARNRLTHLLQQEGATISQGHAVTNLPEEVDWAVRTPAVGEENPEVQALRARGVPVFARGDVLAALSRTRRTLAIAGAHGKTTTAAMLTHLLRAAGVDCGYAIGGETAFVGCVADWGASDWFVCEADESDGTLVHYAPEVGVLTHVEWDHVERFGSESALLDCYRRFVSRCTRVVIREADARARQVTSGHPGVVALKENTLGPETADDPLGQWVQARLNGKSCRFRLPLPGRHNAWNACMALTAAGLTGQDPVSSAAPLASFASVARRFERVRVGGVEIIHDYAHHPTEIRAVMTSARALLPRRLQVAFQPHRFSRTRHLLHEFAEAFSGVDRLFLLPVYAASEAREQGVDSDALREACAERLGVERVALFADTASLLESAGKNLAIGDVFLIVGAGDILEVFERMRAGPGNDETS